MTTCPSGVHYMHLVDQAREYIEATYKRPLMDRMLRAVLALGHPASDAVPAGAAGGQDRAAVCAADAGRPAEGDAAMAPKVIPPVSRNDDPQTFAATRPRAGCGWR
jgi:glycolate oxidase iron-sulfur subunit